MSESSNLQVTLNVSLAWWFKPYLHVLFFFCDIHNTEPTTEHLEWITAKAIRVKRVITKEPK